jgi:RNA polymerase sigma-70 factor, ECF subfamily
MEESMSERAAMTEGPGYSLLALYDVALPDVYGYLLRRCTSVAVAEDLTSETFTAAALALQRSGIPSITTAWLIGVARNKLVDHWRRLEREQRLLAAVGGTDEWTDDWDVRLDALVAHEVLATLAPQHQGALTLRYLDGLPVAEVARHLGRTVGATEVLLVRAKRAFRDHYEARHGQKEADQ